MKTLLMLSLLLWGYLFDECCAQNLLQNESFEILIPPQFGLAKGINLDLWEMLTGSPDVFDSGGNNVTFSAAPKNGELYLNLLNCESVYQELAMPLLPGRSYYFTLFTQSRSQSFFSEGIDSCGDFIVFGSKGELGNFIAQNDCLSTATSITMKENFSIYPLSEEWSGLFWCFSPVDTLHYFGFGIEMPDSCNLSILIDDVSLFEVIPGNGIFADFFKDTLTICPNLTCTDIGVSAPYDFEWSDGGTGGEREFCETGFYTVNYEIGGCALQEEVWIHKPEDIGLLLEDSLTVCEDESVEVNIDEEYELIWNDGTQTNSRSLFQGVYEIAYEAEACLFTEQLTIKETPCEGHPIFIPNAFSPNDDGINDHWNVFMDEDFIASLTSAQLSIFDRWGNPLLQKDLNDLSWDGRINGRPLAEGTYVYFLNYSLVNYETDFILKGDITLIR